MINHPALQQLWPSSQTLDNTQGLYLNQLDDVTSVSNDIFIYANLVSSMDGRIATPSNRGVMTTPKALTTKLDWSLFKELQAQADCLITHGGYLRSLASGELGDILRISSDRKDAYLRDYRAEHQLAPQPDLLILSRSLEFELPSTAIGNDSVTTILTGQHENDSAIRKLEARGVRVVQQQTSELLDAQAVYAQLALMGAKRAYLQTGPHMLGSMLSNKLLSRLYLTMNLRLIGGDQFLSLVQGVLPESGVPLDLAHLYLDENKQLLARLDIAADR